MINFNLLLIVLVLLVSCGGLKEAGQVLRNEKIKTTDEFLVKEPEHRQIITKNGSWFFI